MTSAKKILAIVNLQKLFQNCEKYINIHNSANFRAMDKICTNLESSYQGQSNCFKIELPFYQNVQCFTNICQFV